MKVVIIIVRLPADIHKAHSPSLPGCVALGRSRQEAVERMSRAVAGYLASLDAAAPGDIELQILDEDRNTRGAALGGGLAAAQ